MNNTHNTIPENPMERLAAVAAGATGSGLSPGARHARETIEWALTNGVPDLTCLEIRNAISRLYGPVIDQELRASLSPNNLAQP